MICPSCYHNVFDKWHSTEEAKTFANTVTEEERIKYNAHYERIRIEEEEKALGFWGRLMKRIKGKGKEKPCKTTCKTISCSSNNQYRR